MLSFLYVPTLTSIHNHGKTIALTRWTLVGKVMSLLFNTLSRLVITFLPRIKRLLISWLQSPSAVILVPKKIKSVTVSTVSPSICLEVMGPDVMILVFWMLSFKPTFSLFSFFYQETHKFFFTFCHRAFSSFQFPVFFPEQEKRKTPDWRLYLPFTYLHTDDWYCSILWGTQSAHLLNILI